MATLKTAYKRAFSRIVSSAILWVRRLCGLPNPVIARCGDSWLNLDLREGIDRTISLLGRFEPETQNLCKTVLSPGNIVFDIGADIGSHTVPLVQLVGDGGRVIASEPTGYATEKLTINLKLNLNLQDRISENRIMLVAHDGENPESDQYSSWQLFEPKKMFISDIGKSMDTEGAIALTLDQAVKNLNVEKIDFIKIDVDGNEFSVFNGGKETLLTGETQILMECAPYLFDPESRQSEDILDLFGKRGYSLSDVETGKPLLRDPCLLRKIILAGDRGMSF